MPTYRRYSLELQAFPACTSLRIVCLTCGAYSGRSERCRNGMGLKKGAQRAKLLVQRVPSNLPNGLSYFIDFSPVMQEQDLLLLDNFRPEDFRSQSFERD